MVKSTWIYWNHILEVLDYTCQIALVKMDPHILGLGICGVHVNSFITKVKCSEIMYSLNECFKTIWLGEWHQRPQISLLGAIGPQPSRALDFTKVDVVRFLNMKNTQGNTQGRLKRWFWYHLGVTNKFI